MVLQRQNQGDPSNLCLNLGWKSRKNTQKVAKSFSGAEKDPNIILQKFLDWTEPKSNALAAVANFRRLEQGDSTLAEYIDKATELSDLCEYPPEARDNYFETQQ